MNVEVLNGDAIVIEQKQSIRKTIPMTITVCSQTHDLEIDLLYEEHNTDETQRILYGFKIGEQPLQMFNSNEEGIDFGLLIYENIGDWFDGRFDFGTAEENFEVDSAYEETFARVWEIMENENLV